MKYIILFILLLTGFVVLTGILDDATNSLNLPREREIKAKKRLIFALHPYLSAHELTARYKPLVKYLEKKTGCSISISISKNYKDHIDRAGRDEVDIAYMGPASYVLLTEQYGPKRIFGCLKVNAFCDFKGYIIAGKDNPANSLFDLTDKSFAIGSLSSTMGYVCPRYMFVKAGALFPEKQLKIVKSHDNVALAVIAGLVNAGAVKENVYEKYKNKKALKIIAETPSIKEHLFVAGNKLDEETFKKIQNELFAIKDKKLIREILSPIKKTFSGLCPVNDADYDKLREIIKIVRKDEKERSKK